ETMSSRKGETAPFKDVKESSLKSFLAKLRKRHIIETLAAFIGGGWLLVEVVERLLVGHYKFPEESIDLTVVSVIGALIATVVWRWFAGTVQRPGNIKVEVLLVPLIILATLSIDLIICLEIIEIGGKTLLIAAVAVCMGIGWIILKSLQWAAAGPVPAPGPEQRTAISASSPQAPPEKSIVVLPFADLSPDTDNEYFADGLTEEIIADLSVLDSLRVISRTSAMQLKQTDKDVREIARLLDVQYVLEGSVRKAGNKLRITAQLIQADSDRHLWAEKYDGVLEDVFDIQENVARKIVEALKGRFTPKDQRQLSARLSFHNVGVYEAYSRAHYEFWKSEPESTERALRLLEKAIEVFGEHPLLVSGVGATHWQLYHYRGDLNEDHLTQIKECARKLFAGDPSSAPGHRLSSYLALHAGATAEAIRHLQRAMEGDSSDAETLLWLSYLLAIHAGRPEQARPVAERWVAIDPLHPIAKMSLHLVQWMSGDLKGAIKGLEEWHKQELDNRIPAFYLGHLLAWAGRDEESLHLAEEMFRQEPEEGMGQALRFVALSIHGRAEEAKNTVSPSVKESIWMDFHLPWLMADGYSLLGEKAEALRWLERAVEKGIFNYPLLSELDPLLANIRGEERFKKLIERVKYEWEHFEV
ncbi:MAG: tetratricopeptide repeat protein, partial [Candidatus Aminicenantes bacterium]|nr:tetratricopeptide repeat protein [Candidatus Aminicenantes bacterium]